MSLKPLSDRVVLKQLEAEETTKGGIILTTQAKEKPQEAEVVAVGPGAIELTTIPYWLNFFAIPRVNPCIAHLAILYAETAGLSADEEDIFKIFPLIPFSIIYLDTISDKKYVPFKLVFITES